MKTYPSIPPFTSDVLGSKVICFDKLDGSNIRAEWNYKRGFYKFGTRKQLLDPNDPLWGEAAALIREKFEEDLGNIFRSQKWKKGMAFFEFHGPKSFAGFHEKEPHEVTLLDVSSDQGILDPWKFLNLFGHLNIPKVVYEGTLSKEIVEDVRKGSLSGVTFEGVVCKGKYVSPGLPLLFKIKSEAWLKLVRSKYKNEPNLLREIE